MPKTRIGAACMHWVVVFFYCSALFVQSSFASPLPDAGIPHIDKLMHFGAYAVLGALFWRAWKGTRPGLRPQALALLSITCASLYGISDELHQSMVSERSADALDGLMDVLGAVCGVYLFGKWQQAADRKAKKSAD